MKTIGKESGGGKDRKSPKHNTLEIPVEAIFGNVSTQSTAYMDVSCPGLQPQTIPLTGADVILGRDEDCSVSLPAAGVSRQHAKLTWNGEDCVIEDLDSTNGTFVNNIKISRCVLRSNDQIRLGQATIIFFQQRVAGRT